METKTKELVNFRDLGGLIAADGKTLRSNRILRSGELWNLSDAWKNILLDEHKLAAVIDLRSQQETEEHPDDAMPVKMVHIDVLKMGRTNVANRHAMEKLSTRDDVMAAMGDMYEDFVTNPGICTAYRRFVDVFLQQEDGAVLFHCYAGKDRTGMGAAIILALLGVEESVIKNDYLLSNEMRRAENEVMIQAMRDRGADEDYLGAFSAAMYVEAAYLERSFAAANRDYGSFAEYCRKGLGVTQEEVDRLRTAYLQ